MRPLKNASFCHYGPRIVARGGPDPESGKLLKAMATGCRRYDDVETAREFFKALV